MLKTKSTTCNIPPKGSPETMTGHRIVLTGGGTGGHIYPALSVAEHLKGRPDVEAILYIGAIGHPEEKLARENGLEFVGIKVSGLPRKLSPKLFTWPFEMFAAIMRARAILQAFKPTAVLGTGGYASAPPLAAANMLKIPTAVHEPDAHPGLVNRLLGRKAKLISLGMQGAAGRMSTKFGQIAFNGNPVRGSFLTPMQRDAAAAIMGLRSDLKTVLVTGGSQGAKALNEAVVAALPQLLELEPHIQIVHQCGDKNLNDVKERLAPGLEGSPRYHLRAYFDDLSIAYAVADLAVTRAGAMTVAELAVTGTPAVFVPYPFAAQDHQTHNARYMESQKAATVIMQEDLTGQTIYNQISSLVSDDARLNEMRKRMREIGKPDAARTLAEQVLALSSEYKQTALQG
ncbi:MAG: undecaprenyldiphospho-muramoylpentapeptide beta-N-acetylglucosaminyltransferase [Cyanobacteria bacterium SZAS LIN-3]|nr:undecaprenyldiphospho-muramoylpentapeptide beta-N-acetylglucosaminyltransferase [Cyanobacteria bacterium SZAS LIN-3]MBS2008057.1 undecaprenyldiphospho-muramoylpentapeptide beta-N-acetylglucosaminyltransferase [Cyanobacteria bacterium SZAS TMP-1]